jgi:hypothetical protein
LPLTTLGKQQEIIPDQAAHRHEISQQSMPLQRCFNLLFFSGGQPIPRIL